MSVTNKFKVGDIVIFLGDNTQAEVIFVYEKTVTIKFKDNGLSMPVLLNRVRKITKLERALQ